MFSNLAGNLLFISLLWAGGLAPIPAAGQPRRAGLSEQAGQLRQRARQLEASSEFEQAISVFEQELAIRRQLGDREAEALVLNMIGSAYDSLTQYPEAISRFEQALAIVRDVHQRAGEGVILDNIGSAYASMGDCTRALGYHGQALAVRHELKDDAGAAASLSNLGTCQVELGRVDDGIRLFEQALALDRKTGDPARQAPVLNNLGSAYSLISEYHKAIGYHEQALALRRQIKDRRGEGESLSNIGAAYRSLGQYSEALRYYQEALAIFQEVRDRRSEAVNLERQGSAYTALNQFEKALGLFDRALALSRETLNRRNETSTLSGLGAVYHLLGNYRRALEYYGQAVAISRQIGDRHDEADLHGNQGAARDALGDSAGAIAAYQAALDTYRELNDRQGQAVALNNLGHVLIGVRRFGEAQPDLAQALEIERVIGDRRNEGYTANLIGRIYRERNDLTRAVEMHRQALTLARQVGDPRAEVSALQQLAICAKASGELQLASFYGKQAVNTVQAIRGQSRGLSQRLRESYARSNEDVYRLLADVLVAQGRLPEAQQAMDLLKQEEYIAFVRRDAARTSGLDGRAGLTAEEAEWARRYSEVSDHLVALGTRYGELSGKRRRSPDEDRELDRLEKDLQAGNQAFRKVLDDLARQFDSKPATATVLPLKDIEAFGADLADLPEGAVAIYTIAGEDKLRTILVTPNVRRAYEYPIRAVELNRKIAIFRQVVQNPASDPKPLAEELYRMLIVPALAADLEQAKARTLMFSLDGALRYLPLAALFDGERYLIEKYRIDVFTPASTARLKDEPKADWNMAGFGVTRAFGDFPALPNVVSEFAGILEHDGSGGVLPGEVLLDAAFDRASLTAQLRRGYSVVHIATHFNFAPGDESRSYLLLGDGRRLSLADVDNMVNPFRGVDLLTLSACNTGVGDGREVEGLGVIAQRKGAKAVIATLWPVADDSTSVLMRDFYRIRQSSPRVPKAEALRQAQVRMLTGRVRPVVATAERGVRKATAAPAQSWKHPYYWAPFFLMGNWL